MIRIVFPEIRNKTIRTAAEEVRGIEVMGADNLEEGCHIVARGEADGMVAGIDYTSRDVILTVREVIGTRGKTFSGVFVMERGGERYVVGDAAACKNPTAEQLFEIVCDTHETAKATLDEEPRVAILSFSTLGSGGKDESISRAREVVERVRTERPEILIDGELQLDAAVDEIVGVKKASGSLVAGRANVLIMPDLNSGNILYKAMERFGGFLAAGPILQGFCAPISDLSRGSTVKDVVFTIEMLKKIINSRKEKNG